MIDAERFVADLRSRIALFESDAIELLRTNESSVKERVITLDRSRQVALSLSVRQSRLLDEALACIEHGLFRAAHVAAWQALIDYVEERLATDGWSTLLTEYPKWAQAYKSIDDLLEKEGEHQIIEAAKRIGLLDKGQMKSLHGHLSTRNRCAHPSNYKPGLNQALGYVADLIDTIADLKSKTL